MDIKIYCGEYEHADAGAETIDTSKMTQRQMVDLGYAAAENSETQPVRIFTNCDHILNGIRLYVVTKNSALSLTEGHKPEPGAELITCLKGEQKVYEILKHGRLKVWPSDCFNMITKTLCKLANLQSKMRKNKLTE